MTHTYGPADIERATGGEVTQADLRNWVRAKLFNTELAEPRAGKPREFPLRAVHEAALLSKFVKHGIRLAKAKGWLEGILQRIDKTGVATVGLDGSQWGPDSIYPAWQVILFNSDSAEPICLTDTATHDTFDRAFYQLTSGNGPAEVLVAIHLPATISKINRALGVV